MMLLAVQIDFSIFNPFPRKLRILHDVGIFQQSQNLFRASIQIPLRIKVSEVVILILTWQRLRAAGRAFAPLFANDPLAARPTRA